MSRSPLALSGLGLALTLSACTNPQVGNPCPIPSNGDEKAKNAAIQKCFGQIGDLPVDARLKKDVDILFLIDNSPSMSPKQAALAQNIPKFIQTIEGTGANYHVGIVTSDIGTNTAPGVPWGGSVIGKCDTYEGDDGVLQASACDARTGVTPMAKSACLSLCPDNKYVPTDGKRFISKIEGQTNVPVSMELDPMTGKMVDKGPEKAFKCMALVGDDGCGLEGQLEASKRALDGHRAENSGFLRSNSVLAVIFITDEDDCSVQLAKRNELNPVTRDCDPSMPDSYDCYGIDYRCLARSIQCDQSMLTPGGKTGCKERPNNYLESVSKYVTFFKSLRKSDKLLVSGIWTLPSITAGGKVDISYASVGSTTTPNLNRSQGSGASCVYSKDQGVFGQAQLRLSQFAEGFGKDDKGNPNALEVSICDIDGYPTALGKIADAIKNKLKASCLPVIPKTSNGKPICLVGDVDENTPDASPDTLFPVCSTACCNGWANSTDPTVEDPTVKAACAGETTEACYCAIKSQVGQCTETVVAGVWRKDGAQPPVGKSVNFRCAGGGS